ATFHPDSATSLCALRPRDGGRRRSCGSESALQALRQRFMNPVEHHVQRADRPAHSIRYFGVGTILEVAQPDQRLVRLRKPLQTLTQHLLPGVEPGLIAEL